MNPESDYAANAASICQSILGFDRENPNGDTVKVSQTDLEHAIKKAYQAGKNEKLLHESGVDTELLFWQLMDSLPDNVYFKDLRSRFTCVNMAQAKFLGLDDPNEAIGKSDFDYFRESNADKRFLAEQEIIQTGQGWALHEEIDLKSKTGRNCIISSKLPLHDTSGNIVGTFGISRNVTTRFLAELEIERQRKLLDTIIQILPCRVFVRDNDDRFLIVNDAYCKSVGHMNRDSLIGKKLAEFYDEENLKKLNSQDHFVKSEGRPILNKIDVDTVVSKKQRWVTTSKVPLFSSDHNIEGIVGMIYDITEQKEAEEKAYSLVLELQQKNEQFEAELLVARQLQETLMSMGFDQNRSYSRSGSHWNIDASYYYKPSHHLAGDFFDLVPISEDKIGFLVCDVMGHGVKASLVTMLLRGLILEMPDSLPQPGKVLSLLNNSLCSLAEDQEFPRFVTAVYIVFDLAAGTACIANAGHPHPLFKVTGDNGWESFEPCPSKRPGPALGIILNEIFEQHKFQVAESSEFLLHTDGIVEQKDAMGAEFGIDKMEEILLNNEKSPLTEQLDNIQTALPQTANGKEFDDDICIVAVKLESKR